MEIWAKHPQWEVQVSNLGRVRLVNRKIKKLSRRPDGYLVTSVGGRGFPILRVHRLVLETFVGAPAEGQGCRHLDGNPLNNKLGNLKWGTREEQIADQKRLGRFSPPPVKKGKDNPGYRHPEKRYTAAFKMKRKGLSWRKVAVRTGISKSQLIRRHRAIEGCCI